MTEGKVTEAPVPSRGATRTATGPPDHVGLAAPLAADVAAAPVATRVSLTPMAASAAAVASTMTLMPTLGVSAQTLALPGLAVGVAPRRPAVSICGQRFDALTEAEVIRHILRELAAGRGGWVITPNVDHLRRLVKHPELRALYSRANLVVADGMPLIWVSRLQGTPLPERVAGSSLLSTLSAAAADRGRSIFLLGGDSGTAEASARLLQERSPDLRIAGIASPPPGFERDAVLLAEVEEQLLKADPDIIYVALGSPKQEWLIDRLRHKLPRAWWLGIGISFSLLCGRVRRAPRWMQHAGLEWFHRLLQEPKRLARRYLMHGLPFAIGLLAVALFRRQAASRPAPPLEGPGVLLDAGELRHKL